MSTDLLERPATIVDDATRRRFLTGLAAAGLLAGCGSAEPSAPAEPTGWSFTDDRQETVTLPARPARIAMQEDAAGALMPFGIRPSAVFGNAPMVDSAQFQGVDIVGIEQVGTEFGVINLEKLAALAPDVIVVPLYPAGGGVPGIGGFSEQAQVDLALQIAPIVAIAVTDRPYSALIDRFAELAAALGADLNAPEVVRMRADFESARTQLRDAAAAVPGLTVLAASPTEELVYVLGPTVNSELSEYEALGLDILDPPVGVTDEEVSWERISGRPADVILVDSRTFVDTGFLASHPVWPRLPAVESGQVGEWYVGTMYRMPFVTERLRELAALIERSSDVV